MASSVINLRVGPYVVRELIGSGGTAEVYRADHDQGGVDDKSFAVKVMRPERAADPMHVKNFKQEYATLKELNLVGVPKVYFEGMLGNRPAFVMELVKGDPLSNLVGRDPYLPGSKLLIDLCEIVDYLHRHDLVHNDLKLENAILQGDGRLVLIDFGNVRPAKVGVLQKLFYRRPETIFGTSTYLSPELIQGDRPTPASDVYALGVCTYFLLSGKPPFLASSQTSRIRKHATEIPPSIADRVQDLPDAAVDVIDRTLAKDPKERPTAEEMLVVAKLVQRHQQDAMQRHRRVPVVGLGAKGAGKVVRRGASGNAATSDQWKTQQE